MAAAWVALVAATTAGCAGAGSDLTPDDARSNGTAPGAAAPAGDVTPATGTRPGPAECRGTGVTPAPDLAYRRVDGVDPNLLSLDLYLPARPDGCGPAPLVVYVHGGGFRTGDKANRIADKVALFTGEGWAFASVNYRLSPDGPDDPTAGTDAAVRYPTHEQDVAAAVAWLDEHAATYDLDPGRILLIGHSSGAYLVSLLATDTSFLAEAGVDPTQVRCTASLDTEYDAAAQVAQGGSQEALYRNALGDDPAVWAEASPLTHAADPGPRPSFLVVTQGSPRRTGGSEAFVAALTAGGTEATVLDVSPLDHEGVNAAVGAAGDTVVTPAVLGLFRSCVDRP